MSEYPTPLYQPGDQLMLKGDLYLIDALVKMGGWPTGKTVHYCLNTLVVKEVLVQKCYGGYQVHYDCRVHLAKSDYGQVQTSHDLSMHRYTEAEVCPFDWAAYRPIEPKEVNDKDE